MSPEAISAAAASAGVIAAIWLQIAEWKRSRFARGIDAISALDARFDGPELREVRRRAAAYFLDPKPDDVEGTEAAQHLMNFFETLGFLYEKQVIDDESVWHFFASWILPYYRESQALRTEIAKDDPNVYSSFRKVYDAVRKCEERRHASRQSVHILADDAVRAFLVEEAALATKSLPHTTPQLGSSGTPPNPTI